MNTGAACTRPDTVKASCRNTVLHEGQIFKMMNSYCVGLSKPFKCKECKVRTPPLIALAVRTKVAHYFTLDSQSYR